MEEVKLTCLTATYNRRMELRRLYDSLINQPNYRFRWLIIDDGSTDGTIDFVMTIQKESPFQIEYYYKKNSGKQETINYAVKKIKTEYIFEVDSDDEIEYGAIDNILEIWENLDKEKYKITWEIVGLTVISASGEINGDKFYKGINYYPKILKRFRNNFIKGDKKSCIKTKILKEFPFPSYNDTKYIPESIVWHTISRKYDSVYVNQIFQRVTYNSEGSLMKQINNSKKSIEIWNSFYHYSVYVINEWFDEILYNYSVIFSIIDFSRCVIMSNRVFFESLHEVKGYHKKLLVILGYPIAWIYTKLFYR